MPKPPAPRPGIAPVPSPPGGADALLDSFDGRPGDPPKGWQAASGHWVLAGDASAERGPSVLIQDRETQPWAVILRDGAYEGDLAAQVRFKCVSGKEDASAGLVLRARDAGDYLFCRANALEGNFRLYRVKNGKRKTLESADVPAPAMGTWHTLQVSVSGNEVSCGLDGRTLLTHALDASAWTSGRVGLWTKADSVTRFDDLTVLGIRAVKEPSREEFEARVEAFPYQASPERKRRILEGFPRLTLGMRKQQVRDILGGADHAQPYHPKGPEHNRDGDVIWTYELYASAPARTSLRDDQAISVYFDKRDALFLAMPFRVEGLVEIGSQRGAHP